MFWSRLLESYIALGILLFLISIFGLLICGLGEVSTDNIFVIILGIMFLISVVQLVLYYGVKYVTIFIVWQFIEPYQNYKRKRS